MGGNNSVFFFNYVMMIKKGVVNINFILVVNIGGIVLMVICIVNYVVFQVSEISMNNIDIDILCIRFFL